MLSSFFNPITDVSSYRAFISYSHADLDFAIRLQRDLESYRVPDATVRQLGLKSNRLVPVFRDVSDLAAASRLTGALADALSNSEALIVVCSPDAAASEWVSQEIDVFREVHGEQARILPIIAANVDAASVEDMFPESLRRSVPLAADSRSIGEGRRTALLKIVAGLLGTGLDDLIRRDARRRQRRLLAGTVVSTVVAISMGILALQATNARDDARRRLSQSEDLIGFMLGDLRSELEPLGQVKVLQNVGDKALEYFSSLTETDQTETVMLRHSRALYQIGEVYFELGDFAAAQKAFQLSLDQARRLATAKPKDSDRLYELAWTLHRREPEDSDWIMETFWASNNLGSLAFGRVQYDLARRKFEEAVSRIDSLLERESKPEWLLEKAATLSWLGSTHYRLAELVASREVFVAALSIELDMTNAHHREERAFQLGKLAAIEMHLGEARSARQHIEEATTIARDLAEADPDSMRALFAKLTQEQQRLSIVGQAWSPDAYAELREGVDILLATDSAPANWYRLAMEVADLGIRREAHEALTWGHQLLESEKVRKASEDGGEQDCLNLAVSVAWRDVRQRPRAREALAVVAESYRSSTDFDLALSLLRAYELFEDEQQARDIREQLTAAGSRHPVLERTRAQEE